MNIDLIASDTIAPCIAYDEPFASQPVCVRYETSARRLYLVFEDGAARPIDKPVHEGIAVKLQCARKIMLVQLREGRPVEGFECRLRSFDEGGHEMASA